MLHFANVPIILHILAEFRAITLFIRQPVSQLHDANPSREAILVLQCYAGALLSLNAVCVSYFVVNGVSEFGAAGIGLASSLLIYHIFPMYRAWDRMQRQRLGGSHRKAEFDVAGGPKGNFRGHCIIFVSLALSVLYGVL